MTVALGTSLGTKLGTYLGQDAEGELAQLEAYLARNLFSWIRADYRAESGGKVTTFWDKVALESEGAVAPNARSVDPAHAFSQASAPLQWTVSPSSIFASQPAAATNNDGPYTSTIPATNWAFTENGTGYESWTILSWTSTAGTQVIFKSSGGADVSGVNSFYSTNVSMFIPQSGADPLGITSIFSGAPPTGISRVLNIRHATSNSPQRYGKLTGSAAVQGSYSITPVSEDPNTPMVIGNNPAGSFGLVGMIADCMFANKISAPLLAAFDRYAFLRYGGLVR